MATDVQTVTLAIILGTLLAIVYSIRILVLLERRIARIDHHIDLVAMTILKEEQAVLAEEKRLEKMVGSSRRSSKTSTSSSKKASGKKKSAKKSSASKSGKKKASKSAKKR